MKIGSLFSGYSGLDMAVGAVTGADTAWFVEFDAAPSKILAHHYPAVPNYGDITAVDWAAVEPVDILTGGFPCQDVSLAGRRAGMKDGTRSGLWTEFAKAIAALRPELVVIENVRGLLSAEAHSQVEPCPWCVGDGDGEPPLRALGAVLGDLSDLGYDAEWCGLRAADAGAPHGRYRIFIAAHPRGGRDGRGAVASRRREGAGADAQVDWADPRPYGTPTEDAYLTARRERWIPAPGQAEGRGSWADARGRDRAPIAYAGVGGRVGGQSVERPRRHSTIGGEAVDHPRDGDTSRRTEWGNFEPAIRRWESVTGRHAPAATRADGRDGQHRLNAAFVEWMMGLPAGWVTDPAIGLTRNEQLKALGNGVVPQQAELALSMLLNREEAAS